VGIASAARGDDRRTLFAAADGVLYDAKRSGRDRVIRLSGVTQTRVDANPLDSLFGAPPQDSDPAAPDTADADAVTPDPTPDAPADTADGTAAVVPAGSPSAVSDLPSAVPDPADDGFAPLLAGPRVIDPPLGLGSATEPILGPVPPSPMAATPVVPEAGTPVVPEAGPVRPGPVEPEVIWATGRTTEQVLALVREARHEHPDRPALVLRAPADTLVALATEHDAYTTMDAAAMAAAVGPLPEPRGRVHVLCSAAGDTPVAAEAAFVARVTGADAVRVDDVGAGRIRAMLADGSLLDDVDCLVVVAGLDASLATTIGAMTDVPVVAVPTSTGQPAAFGGLGALMTLMNSTAPGVAVSAIDNGYAAGVFAARVARRSAPR
jgi:NCAIR mutase (PurE)-related protein